MSIYDFLEGCFLKRLREDIPARGHCRAGVLIADWVASICIDFLDDLNHAGEKTIHFNHYCLSAITIANSGRPLSTLMCQPLPQLNILRLCSQRQEVSLHRAPGILLVEEPLGLAIAVIAVHAHRG